jgi:hypothetical protein
MKIQCKLRVNIKGQKINAIRMFRSGAKIGLKNAKDLIDSANELGFIEKPIVLNEAQFGRLMALILEDDEKQKKRNIHTGIPHSPILTVSDITVINEEQVATDLSTSEV